MVLVVVYYYYGNIPIPRVTEFCNRNFNLITAKGRPGRREFGQSAIILFGMKDVVGKKRLFRWVRTDFDMNPKI